ncbi:MAG: hypothetical protein RR527_05290 [Clostridia bacterium]
MALLQHGFTIAMPVCYTQYMLKELTEKYRSLSIIGMCKNAGKTTVLNRLITELHSVRKLALTSIGRDGESVDVVTHTFKPGIYVYEGTLVATAAGLLKYCNITREIVASLGINTPLGEVALVRARSDGDVQLAGPSMTVQLAALSGEFFAIGADMVLIDGAISRKTLCAPAVSEATILCTGASYHKDINVVVEDTAFAVELLTLPQQTQWTQAELELTHKVLLKGARVVPLPNIPLLDALRDEAYSDTECIYVNGALTDAMITPLLMAGIPLSNIEITVRDGSKLLLSKSTYEKLRTRGARISVVRRTDVAAVTVNPISAYGFDFNAAELLKRMEVAVNVPVIDVGRGI